MQYLVRNENWNQKDVNLYNTVLFQIYDTDTKVLDNEVHKITNVKFWRGQGTTEFSYLHNIRQTDEDFLILPVYIHEIDFLDYINSVRVTRNNFDLDLSILSNFFENPQIYNNLVEGVSVFDLVYLLVYKGFCRRNEYIVRLGKVNLAISLREDWQKCLSKLMVKYDKSFDFLKMIRESV